MQVSLTVGEKALVKMALRHPSSTGKGLASLLDVSERTVEMRWGSVYKKLGLEGDVRARHRDTAINLILRNGYLDQPAEGADSEQPGEATVAAKHHEM